MNSCPKCGETLPEGRVELCPHCGYPLGAPIDGQVRFEGDFDRWVVVERCSSETEAVLKQGVLQSADIPCVTESHGTTLGYAPPLGDGATLFGLVLVLVPESRAAEAVDVLLTIEDQGDTAKGLSH